MRRIVWTFGLISGFIIIGMFVVTGLMWTDDEMHFKNGVAVGYTTMIIALSSMFFGIKAYRDQQLNGSISFGKAFLVGLYITLIASTIYAVGWKIYSHFYMPDFFERYLAYSTEEFHRSNPTPEEIDAYNKDVKFMSWIFSHPLLEIAAVFLMEIFPVGIAISLISAAILRRKPRPEAAETA